MKTIQIEATDDSTNFPKSNYAMEVDPSAYFSVIFTDLDIAKVDNPITLNYTFYGSENYLVKGTWQEMNLVFNKGKLPVNESLEGDYIINLTVFIAYATPPESGLSGTLGIAATEVGSKYCVLCKLNETYGVPK